MQWIADYCMLRLETDDEIAASDCIDRQSKVRFAGPCVSNLHYKRLMCRQMIRQGTRTGSVDRCVRDPTFMGRTVTKGGVGG